MEIKIDAEQVNKVVADAILQSAIGETLEKVIKEQVQKLATTYNNPIEPVIRSEIHKIIQQLVMEKYASQIEKFVKEKASEKFTTELLDKLWEAFINKY